MSRIHYPGRLLIWRGMAALALGMLLTVITACGSSTSSGSGNSTTNAGTTASGVPALCKGTPATGTPIVFGQVVSLTGTPAFPGRKAGAQAAAACINAAGGIGGRPIKIDTCDDANNPATARACAETFVSDKVAAVVGNLTVVADEVDLPILQQAGIPMIGASPLSALDFSSPDSFPIEGGSPGIFDAEARYMVDTLHIKSLGIVYSAYAPAQEAADAMAAYFKSIGGVTTREIPLDTTAVDVAPSVVALTAGFQPQAISNMYAGAQCSAGFEAYQSAGLQGKVPIFYTSSCDTPSAISTAGSAANGIYFNAVYPDPSVAANASNTQVKEYLQVMNTYAKGEATGDSPGAYSAVFFMKALLTQNASSSQDITSAKIISLIKAAKNIPIPLETPYTWDPSSASQKEIPPLANPSVAFIQYENGAFKQTTGWINGFG